MDFVELAVAWGGWCTSACGVLMGVLGWIGSLWISLVGGRVVQLLYPPLEVIQEYILGTVEAPGREVAGQSPFEMMGGSPLEQVGCSISPWNMAESAAGD